MFKKTHRLTKTKDIEKVFKQGRSFYNNLLGIKAVVNDLDISRSTVITNLKVSKKAVVRNRVKRQVRSVLEAELPKLKSGFDLAVVCLPTIVGQDKSDIERLLKQALAKLALYQ